MAVLVDTNVVIDFLITREPFYKMSAEVITKCAGKGLMVILHSIPSLICGIFCGENQKIKEENGCLIFVSDFLNIMTLESEEQQ